MAGCQVPSATVLRAFSPGTTFSDAFAYPDGQLNGNGPWVTNGYAQSLDVSGGVLFGSVGIQTGDEADLSGFGITFNGPYRESIIVNHHASLNDAGGTVTFANFNCGVTLTFAPGDGAINQVTSVQLFDNTNNNTTGPYTFPGNGDVTVELEFDGTDFILRFNGVEVTRNTGATTGVQGSTVDIVLDAMTSPPSITLDTLTVHV